MHPLSLLGLTLSSISITWLWSSNIKLRSQSDGFIWVILYADLNGSKCVIPVKYVDNGNDPHWTAKQIQAESLTGERYKCRWHDQCGSELWWIHGQLCPDRWPGARGWSCVRRRLSLTTADADQVACKVADDVNRVTISGLFILQWSAGRRTLGSDWFQVNLDLAVVILGTWCLG